MLKLFFFGLQYRLVKRHLNVKSEITSHWNVYTFRHTQKENESVRLIITIVFYVFD